MNAAVQLLQFYSKGDEVFESSWDEEVQKRIVRSREIWLKRLYHDTHVQGLLSRRGYTWRTFAALSQQAFAMRNRSQHAYDRYELRDMAKEALRRIYEFQIPADISDELMLALDVLEHYDQFELAAQTKRRKI